MDNEQKMLIVIVVFIVGFAAALIKEFLISRKKEAKTE